MPFWASFITISADSARIPSVTKRWSICSRCIVALIEHRLELGFVERRQRVVAPGSDRVILGVDDRIPGEEAGAAGRFGESGLFDFCDSRTVRLGVEIATEDDW